MINELIRYTHEMGWGQAIYNGASIPIMIAVPAMFLAYRKRYGIPALWAILASVIFYYGVMAALRVSVLLENGFQNFSGMNIIKTFVYVPLICILLSKILKKPIALVLSYAGPVVLVWHIIGQSVCPFLGCCAGIPCKWGIWNPALNERVFPIQWLICLVTLAILIAMLRYEKQKDYAGDGKSYPVMLIVYGSARFFLEFLRQREKVFLGVSEIGLHALFMVLVGTVWLFVAYEIKVEKERRAELTRQMRGQ